jgi:hypothetical protein
MLLRAGPVRSAAFAALDPAIVAQLGADDSDARAMPSASWSLPRIRAQSTFSRRLTVIRSR